MKQILFAIAILLLSGSYANSQELVKQAPAGFDSLRTAIPHGKIDTISYASKTVFGRTVCTCFRNSCLNRLILLPL